MILLGISLKLSCQKASYKFARSISFSSVFRASSPPNGKSKPPDKWNYNSGVSFDESVEPEHSQYRRVTANDLEREKEPPTRVKMLARDFIEDSLYNPHYGYFPKQATIVTSSSTKLDFTSVRDSAEFQEETGKRYSAYGTDAQQGPGRQLWHTPTELFKVHSTCLSIPFTAQPTNRLS